MVEPRPQTKRLGVFLIGDQDLNCELTVAGDKSNLYLYGNSFFGINRQQDQCITGTLHDLTRVSLHQCVGPHAPGTRHVGITSNHFMDIFPHFVIEGAYHIHPGDEKISKISFVIDDAEAIFYDFHAFGSVVNAKAIISDVIRA